MPWGWSYSRCSAASTPIMSSQNMLPCTRPLKANTQKGQEGRGSWMICGEPWNSVGHRGQQTVPPSKVSWNVWDKLRRHCDHFLLMEKLIMRQFQRFNQAGVTRSRGHQCEVPTNAKSPPMRSSQSSLSFIEQERWDYHRIYPRTPIISTVQHTPCSLLDVVPTSRGMMKGQNG